MILDAIWLAFVNLLFGRRPWCHKRRRLCSRPRVSSQPRCLVPRRSRSLRRHRAGAVRPRRAYDARRGCRRLCRGACASASLVKHVSAAPSRLGGSKNGACCGRLRPGGAGSRSLVPASLGRTTRGRSGLPRRMPWRFSGSSPLWFAQPELLNRDYPLLLPSVEAGGLSLHWIRDRAARSPVMAHCRRNARSLRLAWSLIVRHGGPLHSRSDRRLPDGRRPTRGGRSDIPLAAFFACAAAFAFLWHAHGERSSLLLFGVFCAGTAATKAEGLGFVIALAVVFALANARVRPKAAIAIVLTAALSVVAALGAWREWVGAHHIPEQASIGRVTDLTLLAHRLDRPPVAAAYLTARMLDPRAWLVVAALVALTARLAVHRRGDALLVWRSFRLALVYALSWRTGPLSSSSTTTWRPRARRVITGPILAWAFLLPLAWGRVDDGRRRAVPSSA